MEIALNKYLHGTVWSWLPGESALIISNDDYNNRSNEINCVSIKGGHEGLFGIDNIQCDQIYTVEKKALSKFGGAVPASVLAAVKAKIQKQFNMSDDKILQSIQETAAKLIGQLARLDSEFVPSVSQSLNDVVNLAADTSVGNVAPNVVLLNPPKEESPKSDKKPTPKKPSKAVSKSRRKKTETVAANEKADKPKRELRSYTDEDEAFVLDGNPSAEEIMARFGYTDKQRVHALKYSMKKRREKRESK